ncbi:MAG TPA: hypothetical protein VHB54_14830 [Mucilaginibacter sp.]|nr:hypothetical protein [Mucilaginibacter sp.]
MKMFYILTAAILINAHSLSVHRNKFKVLSVTTPQNQDQWIFDKVDGKYLKFKYGKSYNSGLYDLKYIGQVSNNDKAPFLIYSGRDCKECDANVSVYIHSPANGHMNVQNGENRYQLPGTEKDYESGMPIFYSRCFFGQVLPGVKGIIWYQKELTAKNTWQNSTFVVNLNSGTKRESTLKGIEKLKLTLQLLAKGSCKEVKGVIYTSEP